MKKNNPVGSEKPVRLAILGLDSNFHPVNWLLWMKLSQVYPWLTVPMPPVEVTAAATLGRSDLEIRVNAEISAKDLAAKHGLRLYATAEELLEQEKPHGVLICGRPSALPPVALRCVQRGIHVYLQKPAGTHGADLERVIAVARQRKVQVAAGATWRYDGAAMATMAQLKKLEIGKTCNVRVMYNHGMPAPETWYSDPSEGGPELWLGWYNIDLLQQFAGSRICRVFATAHAGGRVKGYPHTFVHASCLFENEARGSMDLYGNISYSYPRAEWEILGERGMIRNIQRHDVEIFRQGQPQTAVYRNQFFDGLASDISAWINSWQDGKTTGMTLTEAAHVVRVARAITRSIQKGNGVNVT